MPKKAGLYSTIKFFGDNRFLIKAAPRSDLLGESAGIGSAKFASTLSFNAAGLVLVHGRDVVFGASIKADFPFAYGCERLLRHLL